MTMKKKLAVATLGAMFVVSSIGSAFAAQASVKSQQPSGKAYFFMQRLDELAKEKGITVEELKAQLEQEREAKLAEMAKEKGITVEELKAQLQQQREAKLEEIAKQKGISVGELKAQFEANRKAK